jgi:hypothetical protein
MTVPYDFSSLSPYDFELLAQDLLSRELGVTLESFPPGPDQGIDLRWYRSGEEYVVVQCKHYPSAKSDAVLRALGKEIPKLLNLRPSRYIVVTSAALSPQAKARIVQRLNPFVTGPSDVISRDDLNALIRKHPDIEQAHLKLWMTSTAVLQRIVNASTFTRTAFDLTDLEHKSGYSFRTRVSKQL